MDSLMSRIITGGISKISFREKKRKSVENDKKTRVFLPVKWIEGGFTTKEADLLLIGKIKQLRLQIWPDLATGNPQVIHYFNWRKC